MKEFTNINEQIELLEERNLAFSDKEQAKKALSYYGYYEVVNGYKDTLLESYDPDKFKNGATFDQLYALFQLDKNLQFSVFEVMLELEKHLKTALGYALSEKYGVDENIYLSRTNFDSGKQLKSNYFEIDKSLKVMKKLCKNTLEPYKHYRETHCHIPPWILFKQATFGNIYHFYKLQKSEIKNHVIHMMTGLPLEIIEYEAEQTNQPLRFLFSDTIKLAYKFRNRSAHGGRIYNYRPDNADIRYNQYLHKRMGIDEASYRFGFGRNDLFTLMSALSFLEDQNIFFMLCLNADHYLRKYLKLYPDERNQMLRQFGLNDLLIESLSYYNRIVSLCI